METTAFIILLSVLIWSPLAFGAVHQISQTIMTLAVLSASALLIVQDITRDRKSGGWQIQRPATSFNLMFLVFLFYLLFQLMPLPEAVLRVLSPEALVVAQKSSPASLAIASPGPTGSWHPIGAYAHPVRQSLILWVTYGFFFFGFSRVLNTRRRIEIAVMAIVLLGCFETLYGMGQAFTGSDRIWWFQRPEHSDMAGTYVNRNHFAGLMEMTMALAVLYAAALSERRRTQSTPSRKRYWRARINALLSGEQRFNKRNFVLFSAAVMGVGLLFSGSRGGMLAAAAGLLLMGVLFTARQTHRRKGVLILVTVAIVSIYAIPMGVEEPLSRFDRVHPDMAARERYWRETVRLSQDYPLVGTGIGSFQYVYPKYQSFEDTRRFFEHAHSDWIQFMAEAGVLGLVLLVGSISFFIIDMIRAWRRRHNAFSVCLGIAPFVALIAIGLHSLTDFNLRIPANFLMLAAVSAIGYSAVHLWNPRQNGSNPPQPRYVPLRYKGLVLLALIFCTIGWCGAWAVRHAAAEVVYLSALAADPSKDPETAVGRLETAAAWDPTRSEYLYRLAIGLQHLRYSELLKSGQDAAGRKAVQNRIVGGLEDAVRLNPLHEEAHIRLAWEYTHFWGEPDAKERWMPAADLSMERGAFFAGENNPYLHFWMGDYWLMRSKTVSPADRRWEGYLARAQWHFRKNLALETGDDRKKMVEQIRKSVWVHYPDVQFVERMLKE